MSDNSQLSGRLLTLLKYYGLSVRRFEQLCGMSNGYVKRIKSSLGADIENNILQTFPDVSRIWLLTGEGSMLVSDTDSPSEHAGEAPSRPRIPVGASAGFLSGIATGVSIDDCELIPLIPGIPDYACTIIVHGDSMTPKYESGDELALVPLRDRDSIQWGHTYVLDTEDGVLVKRLYDHNADAVRCVSYNTEYPDSYVDKSSINSIWRIVALLRRY